MIQRQGNRAAEGKQGLLRRRTKRQVGAYCLSSHGGLSWSYRVRGGPEEDTKMNKAVRQEVRPRPNPRKVALAEWLRKADALLAEVSK